MIQKAHLIRGAKKSACEKSINTRGDKSLRVYSRATDDMQQQILSYAEENSVQKYCRRNMLPKTKPVLFCATCCKNEILNKIILCTR